MIALEAWPFWRLVDGPQDSAALLWTDMEVLSAPAANARGVRDALCDELARLAVPEPTTTEFLTLCRAFDQAPAPARRAVETSPRMYHWTRGAHARLQARIDAGPRGPEAKALEHHLEAFKEMALGVTFLSGQTVAFETPLVIDPPFAIPGSRWSIESPGLVRVVGTRHGSVLFDSGGHTEAMAWLRRGAPAAGGPSLRACAIVAHRELELPVQVEAFHVEGLDVGKPALEAGAAYQAENAESLRRAVEAVAVHAPGVFAQLPHVLRLCALKPREAGTYDDFSEPTFPGTFVASVVKDPLDFGDHLVHEFQHNRMSILEETGALFESGSETPAHYSPWRDKPRGLYGIFHGVYVFLAVARYWLDVHTSGRGDASQRAYAIDRLLRLPMQLALAVGVLERHAKLTDFGRLLLEEMARDAERVRVEITRADLPMDAAALVAKSDGAFVPEISVVQGRPLTVGESIREHLQRNDLQGQCAGLLDALSAGAARAG